MKRLLTTGWLLAALLMVSSVFAVTKTQVDTDSAQTLSNKSVVATGGTVARSLESRFGETINVKDKGAIGDGVTDDTVAIQAVLTAVSATGGIVYFPQGTYKITATLTMGSNVLIFGAGPTASVIKGALGTALLQSTNTSTRYYGWGIRDLTFDNTNRATAGGIGINLKNISSAHLSHVVIQNVALGLNFDGTGGGCFYNNLYDVNVLTVTTGAIFTTLANENHWYGGRVSDSTLGIDVDGNTNNQFHGIAIEVFTTGVRIANTAVTQYTSLIGIRLENVPTSGTGITISANGQSTEIIGPLFAGLTTNLTNNDATAMLLSGERNGTFQTGRLNIGNVFGDTSYNAIMYSDASAIVRFRNTTDSGYADVDMKDAIVRTNILSVGRAFAALGTPSNGTMTYCSDCTIANPCAGGGTGAIAKRLNGAWVCN